ncbi:MAG: tRNA (adenosine(37)-N6)-dimethylallyltransferase MiaA [Saprospiraceae bacterium]
MIAGPTASGKTNLAVNLADHFKAHIYSADSRQIYKELTIGTAKPDHDILTKIPHHFINHVSIHQPYTAGKYEDEIQKSLLEYFEDHQVGIVVGGTGLYLKLIVEGLDILPQVNPEVLHQLQESFKSKGIQYLQGLLKEKDINYYHQVDLKNSRRLIRALSVTLSGDIPYSTFLGNKTEKSKKPYDIIGIILDPPREKLYENINQRVDEMMENGLEKEAKKFFNERHLPSLQTVGYSELFEYFQHRISKEKAVELIKQNSRRYAKRQGTWFRKYGYGQIFNPDLESDILNYILHKMKD